MGRWCTQKSPLCVARSSSREVGVMYWIQSSRLWTLASIGLSLARLAASLSTVRNSLNARPSPTPRFWRALLTTLTAASAAPFRWGESAGRILHVQSVEFLAAYSSSDSVLFSQVKVHLFQDRFCTDKICSWVRPDLLGMTSNRSESLVRQ